ncbi:MAG: type IV toxin-antitoxin system AbiEi family antitoxin [Opitutaceae bacterium]|jgi:predicted transcriptional regulator of viral defense system
MENNLRTLGPKEAKTVLSFREQGRSIVKAADIIAILGSEQTARKVIRNLLRKGWLTRLVAGRYLFLPPEHGPENLGENNALALASAVVEPAYVGWWAAASYHGFTTQKPATICVATRRQLSPRSIEGNEIRFVGVVERKFFGFRSYDLYGREATISLPAKTVADCVDRPDLAGGASEVTRIVHGAMSTTDTAEILDDALKMKSTALLQRLGYLTDIVGWNWPEPQRFRLFTAIPKSARTVFGRATREEGDVGYVRSWGLIVHARLSDLLADVPKAKGPKHN